MLNRDIIYQFPTPRQILTIYIEGEWRVLTNSYHIKTHTHFKCCPTFKVCVGWAKFITCKCLNVPSSSLSAADESARASKRSVASSKNVETTGLASSVDNDRLSAITANVSATSLPVLRSQSEQVHACTKKLKTLYIQTATIMYPHTKKVLPTTRRLDIANVITCREHVELTCVLNSVILHVSAVQSAERAPNTAQHVNVKPSSRLVTPLSHNLWHRYVSRTSSNCRSKSNFLILP